MPSKLRLFGVCAGFTLATALSAMAAAAKTYQVTGPVVAISPTTITVQKDDERWEIARDAETKGGADLKVGDRVTIHYRMLATTVETKPAKSQGTTKGDSADEPGAAKKSKKK